MVYLALPIKNGGSFHGELLVITRWYFSLQHKSSLQCEAPKIAKLVYNSNVTMVYGTYNIL